MQFIFFNIISFNIYFEFNINSYKVYLVNKKCSTFVLSLSPFFLKGLCTALHIILKFIYFEF